VHVLQIIGWLGCLYLVVKAFEIGSARTHRSDEGDLTLGAMLAALIAWCGAIGFAIWLFAQGGGFSGDPQSVVMDRKAACVSQAKTSADVLAC
jgi:hypothetical protein